MGYRWTSFDLNWHLRDKECEIERVPETASRDGDDSVQPHDFRPPFRLVGSTPRLVCSESPRRANFIQFAPPRRDSGMHGHARSAGMAFNRLVDRAIDARNPRTENRHLPSGQLSVRGVVLFVIVSVALFVLGTLFFLPNPLPLVLAIPVLGIVFAYSYTKDLHPSPISGWGCR